MWIHSRKGQLEIMGLVIVVILISLGMLFLLKFVVFKPVGEERATFTRSQLATNTLNSLLITTTDCRPDANLKFSELIQKCDGFGGDCNGMDVCDFLEENVGEILDQTLKKWKKKYTFSISTNPVLEPVLEVSYLGCPGEKDMALFFLPKEIGSGQIIIKLEVCD